MDVAIVGGRRRGLLLGNVLQDSLPSKLNSIDWHPRLNFIGLSSNGLCSRFVRSVGRSSRDCAILRIVATVFGFIGRLGSSKSRPLLPGSRKHIDDAARWWFSSILECVRGCREEALGFFLVGDRFYNHLFCQRGGLLSRHWVFC